MHTDQGRPGDAADADWRPGADGRRGPPCHLWEGLAMGFDIDTKIIPTQVSTYGRTARQPYLIGRDAQT
jgi:hypothetical protein